MSKFFAINDNNFGTIVLDDDSISSVKVWSSSKTNDKVNEVNVLVKNTDNKIESIKTDVSNVDTKLENIKNNIGDMESVPDEFKGKTLIEMLKTKSNSSPSIVNIDDNIISSDKVWSSYKVNNDIKKIDNKIDIVNGNVNKQISNVEKKATNIDKKIGDMNSVSDELKGKTLIEMIKSKSSSTPSQNYVADNEINLAKTWSSYKINNEVNKFDNKISNINVSVRDIKNNIGNMNSLPNGLKGKTLVDIISLNLSSEVSTDDNSISEHKSWSSYKVNNELNKIRTNISNVDTKTNNINKKVESINENIGDMKLIPNELKNKTLLEMVVENFISGVNVKNNVIAAINSKGGKLNPDSNWDNIVKSIKELKDGETGVVKRVRFEAKAPYIKQIDFKREVTKENFTTAILRFVEGKKGQKQKITDFESLENNKFKYDSEYINFSDDNMELKNYFKVPTTKKDYENGVIFETECFNFTKYSDFISLQLN